MKHIKLKENLYYIIPILLLLCSCKKDTTQVSAEQALNSNATVHAAGIAGFDFSSPLDKVIAFDFEHTGKADWLVCYRPGSKVIFFVKHNPIPGTPFTANYQLRNGFPGYDLADPGDVIMPFDWEHSGKEDYLLVYRPGKKLCSIFQNNNNGTFTSVFNSNIGIGGFNLDQTQDRIFSYDFAGTGKMDYLVVYRSVKRDTKGIIYILKNKNTRNQVDNFEVAFSSSTGIGDYLLNDETNQMCDYGMSFDYNHTGLNNHLIFYYSKNDGISKNIGNVIKNTSGSFSKIFNFELPNPPVSTSVFRTYNFAFDFDKTGRAEYLINYFPARGNFNVYKNNNNDLNFQLTTTQMGVAGFDLSNGVDKLVPFDYDHTGRKDALIAYRPGSGAFWIITHASGPTWNRVY